MVFPSRDDVARPFSEAEAFEHAESLYREQVTANMPLYSVEIAAELEGRVFRPACELQLAGLCLLGGRNFAKPQAVVVSLACFTVDHLIWGWNAAVAAQPRVASTLSRALVEASIFSISASENFDAFQQAWDTPRGTGGAVLRSLKSVQPRVRALLEQAWKVVVPLGHASVIPVMSAHGTFLDGAERVIGISFAGQYAGPLDASLLRNLINLYCLASSVAVEAMKISLQPLFTEAGRWDSAYRALRETLETRMPLPKHLEPYFEKILEMRRKGGQGTA